MKTNDLLNSIGRCYNIKDFSELNDSLNEDVAYESYDCMYKITETDELVNVLNGSVKENTKAYSGYYRYRDILFYHLKEVVLICDSKSLAPKKMFRVTKKKKTLIIEGLKAKDFAVTRGELIS